MGQVATLIRAIGTAGLLWLLAVAPAAAQGKVSVELSASVDDPAGLTLLYRLREAIGRSGVMTEGSGQANGFKINIVTLDPYEKISGSAGKTTIYSISMVMKNPNGLDYFMTSWVGVCAVERAPSCADNLMSGFGSQIEIIRKLVNQNQGFNK